MKESYVRISDPHRPRVLRSRSRGRRRSVDRGTCGPGIQPRKKLTPGRRRCKEKAEGPIRCADIARCIGVPRGQRPRARTEAPCAGTGRSHGSPRAASRLGDASGSLRTYADDERTWEVGQTRSTGEVPEQCWATGGGGDGGKGSGQREPAHSKTRPGHRAGTTRPVRWSGYVKQQARIRSCGSRRSCTTSITWKRCAGLTSV